MPHSLIGKWRGGPHNTLVTISHNPGGGIGGKFRCPSGEWGSFKGLNMDGGRRLKGTYVDPDAKHSNRPDDQRIDIKLDSTGSAWTASITANGAPAGTWRGEKIAWKKSGGGRVWYKNKECWDRLLKQTLSKTPEWQAAQSQKVLQEATKATPFKNGLLSDTAALGIGDPYEDHDPRPERERGTTFKVGTSKVQRKGGLFSELRPLAAGEKYVDAAERRRRAMAAKRIAEEQIERPPFRPQGQVDSRPSYVDAKTSKKDISQLLEEQKKRNRKPRKTEVVTRARNFLTAPPKAGHYGQGDSLLGHKSQEGRKLFAVAEEDYSAAERAIKAERAKLRSMVAERPPFRSASSRSSRPFTSDALAYKGVAPGGPQPPRPRRKRPVSAPVSGRTQRSVRGDARSVASDTSMKPFVAGGKRRTTLKGTFNPFPAYIPEPASGPTLKPAPPELRWQPPRLRQMVRPVGSVMLYKTNLRRHYRGVAI